MFLFASLLFCLPGSSFEVPQIWTLDGVSLSWTRAELEQRLGPPESHRWLPRSQIELRFSGGLRASFSGPGQELRPWRLVGQRLRSRGEPLLWVGQKPQQVLEAMGAPPDGKRSGSWSWSDGDRRVRLEVRLDSRCRSLCLQRL